MKLHKLAYRGYAIARTAARATGLIRLLRRSIGPMALRFLYRTAGGTHHTFLIRGHKMFLTVDNRYPAPDMVVDRYEVPTTRLLEQLLKPGMVFIDVGAHVGYYSLLAAKQVGPTGKVFAFEPEPSNYGLLLRNIELNEYPNILASRKAILNRSDPVELFLSKLDTGSHSVYLNINARGSGDSVHVESTTLDAFLESEGWPRVDMVKIDVEGAELAVLEGMSQLLEKGTPLTLVMEFCPVLLQDADVVPSHLLDKLSSLGFKVDFIDEKKGMIPSGATDVPSLIGRLLRQQTYVNLICIRE